MNEKKSMIVVVNGEIPMEKLLREHCPSAEYELKQFIEAKDALAFLNAKCNGEAPLMGAGVPNETGLGLVADQPTLHELEKRYIEVILKRTGGRKDKASRILGINRRTLYRKEREYGWVSSMPEALSLAS